MLFRKKHKRAIPPVRPDRAPADTASLYPIEYEMMLKGSINTRQGIPVRQFGVYVNGVIRLVTSGDRVDRETYEALLAVGAIQGGSAIPSQREARTPKRAPLIEDSGADREY